MVHMNLGHFCNLESNHLELEYWPRHKSCSGKALNGWGPKEIIVRCDCECHPPVNYSLVNIKGIEKS